MKTWLKKVGLALGFGLLYFWPQLAFGQSCPTGTIPAAGTCVPTNVNSRFAWGGVDRASTAITRILDILLLLVGLIAVLYVVVGGYKYVTAGGDEEQLKGAKKTIFNALIGVAVVLLALALVRIVANALTGPGGV